MHFIRIPYRSRGAGGLLAACSALILTGCATLPNGRTWGADSTVQPGWRKVGQAALAAVEAPGFWAPLAGAAVLQIDDWDHRVSHWARHETPIFGSQQNAALWSDRLRAASGYAWFATVAATPGGDQPGPWLLDKVRGLTVDAAAIFVTDEESMLLKHATARERPNGQDDQSMPSSHASRSAVLTELGRRNMQWVDVSEATRSVTDAGLTALTLGTGWARVEAGFHYPSDVLVGMAIGNFNGAFFDDAFMGLPSKARVAMALQPVRAGAQLRVQLVW
ncbi:MAG TPA: phosphatase PAP2 family protein [Steroidobacteraceae bacterium]|nr:phosphatase PAP2 family protein [Steroidobacteraceae bacterium]